nr:immunoglobulin light chain junction region [Macaca mulatta]
CAAWDDSLSGFIV